ncbi:exonuclease domain-containing protein [Levilactobacillus brevis]|uniref:exonuclease domain-containing protein n=1 Tax=Levilactobacillus brevis TaxID=1580 RepID=UPI002277F847|nr:exonuclease domain-containing protein [Levilactobacillus brevis]WAE45940.1 exonuclease domain-containing protein [Levilactobacillus brevis]
MYVEIGMGTIKFVEEHRKKTNRDKGKSIVQFPKDFTIIDLETTGLDPNYDDIIEIGAIKVRNNEIQDTLSIPVLPSIDENFELPYFIESLTGISTTFLKENGTPTVESLDQLLKFVNNDIVMGYNVSFDINFIYDKALINLERKFKNDYVDIMRIAKRSMPELKHHRVKDMIKVLNISDKEAHRALPDCTQEIQIYNLLKDKIANNSGLETFLNSFNHKKNRSNHSPNIKAKNIETVITQFDELNPFFNKHVAFTGGLDTMTRKEAMQTIKDLGGLPQDNVTKQTDYLLLGNKFYLSQLKDGKSSKYKKALKYKQDGQPIEIINESILFDMLTEN